MEDARAGALEARAQDAALAAELSALAQERATIDAEQGEVDTVAAALVAQIHELASLEAADTAQLRADVGRAEAERDARLRRDVEARDGQTQAQDALSSARDRVAHARARMEQRRQAERERAAEVRRQELERAQLDKGLQYTSGRECLPLPICIGQLLQINEQRRPFTLTTPTVRGAR